jgi:hypothetical protein
MEVICTTFPADAFGLTFRPRCAGRWLDALPESRSLPCADGARQREENARHRLCRAHFAQAHGKGRPTHFYPVKNFAVRFGKRQRTAQLVAVPNRRRTAKKRC